MEDYPGVQSSPTCGGHGVSVTLGGMAGVPSGGLLSSWAQCQLWADGRVDQGGVCLTGKGGADISKGYSSSFQGKKGCAE